MLMSLLQFTAVHQGGRTTIAEPHFFPVISVSAHPCGALEITAEGTRFIKFDDQRAAASRSRWGASWERPWWR
jgi:hypothetical protein